MAHPRVGVGVIVQKGGHVLIGQRKGSLGDGHWALPGGHLEYGESFEACATREVLEETGIAVSDVCFATAENTVFPEGKHYVTIFMHAQAPTGADARLMEPDKCSRWCWVMWEDLKLHKPLFQPLQQLVQRGYKP